MIELTSIKKVFHSNGTSYEALKGLEIKIKKGDFISIVGHSGSGKSTLLSIIGGITYPSSGSVIIDSIPIYELSVERLADYRREYIGFVFQQFHLIPYLTAVENVMLPLCITKKQDIEKLAREALEKIGLGRNSQSLPSQLSGGEQQRVAIARAIVNDPPIILADEPTGNLDTDTGNEIFKLFEELNNKGHTVIVVTHNLELTQKTQRTIRLKDGVIIQ